MHQNVANYQIVSNFDTWRKLHNSKTKVTWNVGSFLYCCQSSRQDVSVRHGIHALFVQYVDGSCWPLTAALLSPELLWWCNKLGFAVPLLHWYWSKRQRVCICLVAHTMQQVYWCNESIQASVLCDKPCVCIPLGGLHFDVTVSYFAFSFSSESCLSLSSKIRRWTSSCSSLDSPCIRDDTPSKHQSNKTKEAPYSVAHRIECSQSNIHYIAITCNCCFQLQQMHQNGCWCSWYIDLVLK